jgi:hypothetical protein
MSHRKSQKSVPLAIFAAFCYTVGLGTSNAVLADVIVYEGFDYKDGDPLKGQNGGVGWKNAWGAGSTSTIMKPSLVDPSGKLATVGNSALTPSAGSTLDPRTLPAALGGDNSTKYVSFLLTPRAPSDVNTSAGLLLPSTKGGLLIGESSGSLYGLTDIGTNTTMASNTIPRRDTTVFLVVKAQFGNGTNNDTFSLYVNPTPGDAEPAKADASLAFVLGQAPSIVLDATYAPQAGVTQWQFDEIRIGTTFADVTPKAPAPEPGSLVLAFVGGSLLLMHAALRHSAGSVRARRAPI